MKKIIASKNFTCNLGRFVKGEELNNLSYSQVAKLNELGYIEPLNYNDLVQIEKELNNKKKEESK